MPLFERAGSDDVAQFVRSETRPAFVVPRYSYREPHVGPIAVAFCELHDGVINMNDTVKQRSNKIITNDVIQHTHQIVGAT